MWPPATENVASPSTVIFEDDLANLQPHDTTGFYSSCLEDEPNDYDSVFRFANENNNDDHSITKGDSARRNTSAARPGEGRQDVGDLSSKATVPDLVAISKPYNVHENDAALNDAGVSDWMPVIPDRDKTKLEDVFRYDLHNKAIMFRQKEIANEKKCTPKELSAKKYKAADDDKSVPVSGNTGSKAIKSVAKAAAKRIKQAHVPLIDGSDPTSNPSMAVSQAPRCYNDELFKSLYQNPYFLKPNRTRIFVPLAPAPRPTSATTERAVASRKRVRGKRTATRSTSSVKKQKLVPKMTVERNTGSSIAEAIGKLKLPPLDPWQTTFIDFLTSPSEHFLESTGQPVPLKEVAIWGRQKVKWAKQKTNSSAALPSTRGGNLLPYKIAASTWPEAVPTKANVQRMQLEFTAEPVTLIRRTNRQALLFEDENKTNELGQWVSRERKLFLQRNENPQPPPLLTPTVVNNPDTKTPLHRGYPQNNYRRAAIEERFLYMEQSFRFNLLRLVGVDLDVPPAETLFQRNVSPRTQTTNIVDVHANHCTVPTNSYSASTMPWQHVPYNEISTSRSDPLQPIADTATAYASPHHPR